LKTEAIKILKLIGLLLLLAVLVNGIAGLLLYVDPAKDWLLENEDGDGVNVRLSVAWFGGLVLWFWLIVKIRKADMDD